MVLRHTTREDPRLAVRCSSIALTLNSPPVSSLILVHAESARHRPRAFVHLDTGRAAQGLPPSRPPATPARRAVCHRHPRAVELAACGNTALEVTPRTLYRHHEQIRAHLQVKAWGAEARHTTIMTVHQVAQVMDHPADLINVAIEDLVRQRFELPAFSTLDALTTHVRAVVHRRLFATVLERLSEPQCLELDALLERSARTDPFQRAETSAQTPIPRTSPRPRRPCPLA